ncbi:MAG TPA: hypothetical protein DC023_01285 [Oceanospirillaceae bacterium]|nr:hypothetical protein [Oceanospirillaceae bacterium]
MVVLCFFQGLVRSYRNRLQARKNWCAVAHLSDDQLLDIGLYRAGDKIRAINKPKVEMIRPPESKNGAAKVISHNEEDGCTNCCPCN